jgi:acyl dehydratase
LTASAAWNHDAGAWPAVLAIEILAQAAAVVLAQEAGDGDPASGRGWLAGVDEARFLQPLAPGMTLRARVSVEGRFGRMVKVRGELLSEPAGETAGQVEGQVEGHSAGQTVASAGLLLAMEG